MSIKFRGVFPSSSRESRGRKFQREKNYKPKKEFAYRICTRRPTSAMPTPIFWCERTFGRSTVVMWCAVMWCDVLWCREVGCGLSWRNLVGCEVTCGELMWLVATCRVMWCDVMWCNVISCQVIWSCFLCPVMSCGEKWCPWETWLVPSWRRILYGKIQHFALRLSPTLSRNSAPATKSDTPNSAKYCPCHKKSLLWLD